MTHSEMNELYELYLLGELDAEERAEIDAHLAENCEQCQKSLAEAAEVLAALAAMAPVATAPERLRDRVLSIAPPRVREIPKKRSVAWPLIAAIAAAAALAVVVWGVGMHETLMHTQARLLDVTAQRNDLRAAIAILSEPDTRTVKFGEQPAAPHGRVFVSQRGGVVFVGSHLPDLATGKTFEFWLVPAKGNPEPAGLFRTNAQGLSVNVLAQTIQAGNYAAVAVSVEPERGSPQPSSKPILVVPLA